MHKRKKAKDPDFKPGATHNAGRSTYYKESQSTKAQLNSLLKGDGDHMGPEGYFFATKKKQRKCITGSVLDVVLILKTLTFKSGIKGLKIYRTIRT